VNVGICTLADGGLLVLPDGGLTLLRRLGQFILFLFLESVKAQIKVN
jgi:hypothetical protein